ncbi:MAG TPA: SigB/SigF/SigG family RNA polymerase sigma factor [Baekduia sp.]
MAVQPQRHDPPERRRDAPADLLLLRRFARTRDAHDRERLVHRYMPLVRYAANHYTRRSETYDDLVQVASVGLLKAIDRYDPANGVAFASYALPTMLGELRRHFRDHGWSVRPPRALLEHALLVERTTDELSRVLGRSPTVAELSAATGLDDEAVLDARQASGAHHASSLATPVGGDYGDQDGAELGDLIGAEDPGYDRVDDRATVDPLMRTLTHRDREVLRLRLEEDLTQSAIGERVGLSQMHVSRILRDVLDQLNRAAAQRAAAVGQVHLLA